MAKTAAGLLLLCWVPGPAWMPYYDGSRPTGPTFPFLSGAKHSDRGYFEDVVAMKIPALFVCYAVILTFIVCLLHSDFTATLSRAGLRCGISLSAPTLLRQRAQWRPMDSRHHHYGAPLRVTTNGERPSFAGKEVKSRACGSLRIDAHFGLLASMQILRASPGHDNP